jgi:hypothetical protein
MSDGPKLLRDLGNGWELRQWEYDGAPLELRHVGRHTTIEAEANPTDLEVRIEDTPTYGYGSNATTISIPMEHLRVLLGLP